jgi:hypothetical protein
VVVKRRRPDCRHSGRSHVSNLGFIRVGDNTKGT